MGKLQKSSNIPPSYGCILGYSNEYGHHKGLGCHKDAIEMHFNGQNKIYHNFFNISLREKNQKLTESL